jgi:hypothetical protein
MRRFWLGLDFRGMHCVQMKLGVLRHAVVTELGWAVRSYLRHQRNIAKQSANEKHESLKRTFTRASR